MSSLVPPKLETLFQLVDLIAKDKAESDRLITRGLCLGLALDGLVSWAPAASLRTRVYTAKNQHGRVGMWTVCNIESLFAAGLSVDSPAAQAVMTRQYPKPIRPAPSLAAVRRPMAPMIPASRARFAKGSL